MKSEGGGDDAFDALLRRVAASPAVKPRPRSEPEGSTAEVELPRQIAGRYRPLRLIGRGGMGSVYEVEHMHTGQHLALKVLIPRAGASVDRFRREARAASRIRSDHVVRVTDADVAPELNGVPFLVMELLDGADLERVTRD